MKKIVALVLSLVMVLGLATTAFGAVATYDLYDWNDTEAQAWQDVTRTKVAAKAYTEAKGFGQVACWKISDGTTDFYAVEITKAEATNADFYLTKAGDDDAVMYLKQIENAGVYTLTGKVVDNYVDPDADPFCGQWDLDPLTTKVYLDSEGDFYVTGTTAYMLVDGAVVGVDAADVVNDMIGHDMEGVYDAKDKLVGVKCAVCGATGTVYASADKAPLGAILFPVDGTAVYVLDAVKAPAATDSDKVESAETFDAGIAMYVGMSVMAAAGSAVVLKKKD